MLHNAVRAFVDGNTDLAHSSMLVEPQVDHVRDVISGELLEAQAKGRLPLEALNPLTAVARRYERVSDQAMNICEETLYYATGEYARHLPQESFQVVFVDETHGPVSRMAEAIACSLGAKRFSFTSAGLVAGAADPQAVWFLSQKGLDISHQRPRSVEEVVRSDQPQMVIVLSKAAEIAAPRPPAKALSLRWLVSNPSRMRGTPEEVRQAYERTFELLTTHIKDLVKAVLWEEENGSEETNATN
jgi:arsenate reductase